MSIFESGWLCPDCLVEAVWTPDYRFATCPECGQIVDTENGVPSAEEDDWNFREQDALDN